MVQIRSSDLLLRFLWSDMCICFYWLNVKTDGAQILLLTASSFIFSEPCVTEVQDDMTVKSPVSLTQMLSEASRNLVCGRNQVNCRSLGVVCLVTFRPISVLLPHDWICRNTRAFSCCHTVWALSNEDIEQQPRMHLCDLQRFPALRVTIDSVIVQVVPRAEGRLIFRKKLTYMYTYIYAYIKRCIFGCVDFESGSHGNI